jgi:hypothetical protein
MIARFHERLFHHEGREDHESFGYFDYKLRALRVLRGDIDFCFSCGLAGVAVMKLNHNKF